jgi:anti-sigma regulatory factor (Ser/Thr protein kinase)
MNQQSQQTVVAQARLHQYAVPLSATRRGARLARLLAAEQLDAWGVPSEPARLIVAELAANAVLHGRVPGRSFRLALAVTVQGVLRIEVTDPSGDVLPVRESAAAEPAESGYGLLLVEELADRWGVRRGPVPCKTVWAELDPCGPSAHFAPEPGSA